MTEPVVTAVLTREAIETIRAIARQEAEAVLAAQLTEQSCSPYLTIREAAEVLRCSRQRIDDLLSRRRLTRFKDGRRTLLLRTEIEAYLRDRA